MIKNRFLTQTPDLSESRNLSALIGYFCFEHQYYVVDEDVEFLEGLSFHFRSH